jgi:hypothetical protein
MFCNVPSRQTRCLLVAGELDPQCGSNNSQLAALTQLSLDH